MTVTVEYAAKHLDELLDTLDSGKSVEIVRPDKPTLRLSGETQDASSSALGGKRILGAGKAEGMDFLVDHWDEIDREWRKSFEDKFDLDEAR